MNSFLSFKDQWEKDNDIDNSSECDSIAVDVQMTPQRKKVIKKVSTESPAKRLIRSDPKGTSSFKSGIKPEYRENVPGPGQYTISHKQIEGTTKGAIKIKSEFKAKN